MKLVRETSELTKRYDVLIVISHYLPGRSSGGPVTSIENLVKKLGNQIRIVIVTQNYDLDGSLYSNIIPLQVYKVENADVIYLNKEDFRFSTIQGLAEQLKVSCIYLNSFFSKITVESLFRMWLLRKNIRVVVAVRGEFSPGALKIKAWKKQLYIKLSRNIGIMRHVIFQATSAREEHDITKNLGKVQTMISMDIPADIEMITTSEKHANSTTKLVFISRIVPMKNLTYALRCLSKVKGDIIFDIFGTLEDHDYWEECKNIIAELPPNIRVKYNGVLKHDMVRKKFQEYDAFLFPTAGENLGHVIFESLSAGCPVIISDQTPWQDLECKGVGWVIPLEKPDIFTDTIQNIMKETAGEKHERSGKCLKYAIDISQDKDMIKKNLELFGIQTR
ncbi:glycosyltransferase family 4 protein [Deinococcus ruber]|uniref:Glycosyl transferase family 1 domain-containing protein n=1 Tax=Deinococcus ruber TaxID=1848197 RepID=A0A918KVS5_9DEIO|nr:glycosyltransferase [Deinococcus ruber]GGR36149.1 hypothetical protein GCM10008957_52390 [Deinococcus ruber]